MRKNLYQLQSDFQAYLEGASYKIVEDIIPPPFSSIKSRLEIYQKSYFIRLIESLICDYPATHKLTGEDLFQALGKQYILQHPSKEASLQAFGKKFPTFLETAENMDQAGLAELANFELALANAFEAADASTMTADRLQSIAPEKWPQLTFRFHPSVQLLSLEWNTVPRWKALHKNITPPPVKKYLKLQMWLIFRKQMENHFVKLSQREAWMLQAAIEKIPLSEICENLTRWIAKKDVIFYASHVLNGWIQKGLIL